VAADLHTLLNRARIAGPFVLVGHSSGAQYVRIFTDRYPREVAGAVLLDGQPPEAFESLPGYPAWYSRFRLVLTLLPGVASLRDEFAALPQTLAQARAAHDFGNRPLVVVTAGRDPLAGWLTLQDRMARLSTNSSHRIVPYTHDALVTDRTAAQTSIEAIRDVVHAVRLATPLKKS
jgi:pimeloyl-ACP methyl ester carboxylesterase